MRVHKLSAELSFKNSYTTDLSIGATQSMLSKVLRSADLVGWSRREESGRLDRKGLTRYATGSTAVFSRREIKEAERASVYILVDCSGSMCKMMGRAQTLTIQLAKMLEKAKVNYAVRGFYGHTDGSIESNEAIFREEVTQIQFKNWNESLAKANLKMGSIHNAACGSTPEYSGLYCAIEELSKRPDPKKVLFFLTDADGFDVENIQHLEDLAEKLGVKIVAVGIDSPDVTRAFKQAVNVRDVSDLGGASFRALLKTVR